MTGRHGGVVTLLEAEATHSVLRVWCAAHQMDLVMKAAFAIVGDGNFVKKTKDLIVHLRRQKNLIAEMGGAARKLTNRWLYMGNAMRWILQHRVRLAEHFDQNGSMLPLPEWWVNAAVVNGITAVVNATFVKIQAKKILLSQQMAEIDILVVRLRSLLSVQPVVDGTFAHGANDTVSEKYWLKEQHLVNFVKDQGSYVTTHLDTDEKQSTLKLLGKFVLHVIEGMELVQAERNSNNEAAELVAPPVMPSKLAQIPPREFVSDLLDPHRIHLANFWNQAQIEAVESEHRELCQADMLNDYVKRVLDEETYETNFNDGWDTLQVVAAPRTFSHLRQFCCGLATVFANTASVESDFSVLKWELNDRRTALTSLPLEGIFQAKQFDQLNKLSKK